MNTGLKHWPPGINYGVIHVPFSVTGLRLQMYMYRQTDWDLGHHSPLFLTHPKCTVALKSFLVSLLTYIYFELFAWGWSLSLSFNILRFRSAHAIFSTSRVTLPLSEVCCHLSAVTFCCRVTHTNAHVCLYRAYNLFSNIHTKYSPIAGWAARKQLIQAVKHGAIQTG